MKYIVVLLFLSLQLVHSKSHHAMRHLEPNEESEFPGSHSVLEPVDDDEPYKQDYNESVHHNNKHIDYEEKYRRERKCYDTIESCADPLISKYNIHDMFGSLLAPLRFRLAGARAACSDGLKYGKCVLKKFKEPACEKDSPAYMRSAIEEYWKLGQAVCVDRIDDFAKHWHCIFSLKVIPKLSRCDPYRSYGPGFTCNISSVVECVVQVYESIPECEAGSSDFIRDILPRYLNGMHFCPERVGPGGGPGPYKRSLQEFL